MTAGTPRGRRRRLSALTLDCLFCRSPRPLVLEGDSRKTHLSPVAHAVSAMGSHGRGTPEHERPRSESTPVTPRRGAESRGDPNTVGLYGRSLFGFARRQSRLRGSSQCFLRSHCSSRCVGKVGWGGFELGHSLRSLPARSSLPGEIRTTVVPLTPFAPLPRSNPSATTPAARFLTVLPPVALLVTLRRRSGLGRIRTAIARSLRSRRSLVRILRQQLLRHGSSQHSLAVVLFVAVCRRSGLGRIRTAGLLRVKEPS